LDWLVLKDVLNTACNITSAAYMAVGGWRGGCWINDARRHRRPSCVHSGPDRWPQQPRPYNKVYRCIMGQNWTPNYPINAPQGPRMVYYGSLWLDRVGTRPSVKVDLLIYTSLIIVSGQCTSVAIAISNKINFNSCVYMKGFHKSSHIWEQTIRS